jgi:ABC-2 type transport system ATP-binding protein
MVGLQHQSRRRIGEYSKGMARRIGLAQALINDPDFLILDEPTTGMDPIGTRQIKDLIRELARRGKTILLSSHLLSDVQDVCDRVCILYGGTVRAEGPVMQLLSREQKTQITAPRLSPEEVERIRKIAAGDGRRTVEISHPTEPLESFFVRIVEQAQAAHLRTSGVAAASGVADFLTEPAGSDVIASLVTAGNQPAAPESPAAAPVPNEPVQEVLGDLLKRPAPQEPAAPAPARSGPRDAATRPAASAPDQPDADRAMIDALLGRPKQPRPPDGGREERGGG